MRLCKDCAHFQPNAGNVGGPLCEGSTYVSMIDGETKLDSCALARSFSGECGAEGKLFVPADAFAEADATIGATALAG